MQGNIGTKQKELWKRHGIAERKLILKYLIVDKQKRCIKSNETKDMNTLIIQIEDLGVINKITLYFDDYRDERFFCLKELLNNIKTEQAFENLEEQTIHTFNIEIYTEEEDDYISTMVSEKEVFIDETENLVSFICQKKHNIAK